MATDVEHEKQLAAEAAAELVEDGMALGLGTGSTATLFVAAVAARGLSPLCVATSPAIESVARALGLRVVQLGADGGPVRLDLAVDGADQVAADGWIVKGNGGAHTREKIVACSADRFVVIVSSDKLVERIASPIPVEVLAFGLRSTLARLEHVRLRDAPRTPDGGVLGDWHGPVGDPAALTAQLDAAPGIVEHGLFPPEVVSDVFVGRGDGVERLPGSRW